MSTYSVKSPLSMHSRRSFLLLPLALMVSRIAIAAPEAPALPAGVCPLNSGGPSLLGSKWRLDSIYGHQIPEQLAITMEVGENAIAGFAGCNKYIARFKRVGHTGFMMTGVEKGNSGCTVLSTGPGLPTINVGDWEGNYVRTLQRAGSVQQENDGLHFFNRSGEPSVIFTRYEGDVYPPEMEGTPAPAS